MKILKNYSAILQYRSGRLKIITSFLFRLWKCLCFLKKHSMASANSKLDNILSLGELPQLVSTYRTCTQREKAVRVKKIRNYYSYVCKNLLP